MDEKIFKWVADYCMGRLSREEGKKLRRWIDEAPENRQVFEQYLQLVKMHRMIEGGEMIRESEAWNGLCRKMKQQRIRRWVKWTTTVAASLLILLGVGIGISIKKQTPERIQPVARILPGTTRATLVLANGSQVDLTRGDLKEIIVEGTMIKNDTCSGLQYELNEAQVREPVVHTIQVPVAGEYHFTLSDGTKVWLNSDTEIKFPVAFVGDKREVFVTGEAYFEVQSDSVHPFIVHANKVEIRVLGTKFNVAAYKENQKVVTTLARGSVQVGYAGQVKKLLPGGQAIADPKSRNIDIRQVDTDMYISWINGIFEYENMPLSEIAVQLSRWYDVNFIFSAPEFKDRHFTGVVKKYDILNDVLKIIEKTTNVSFMIDNKNIAVKSVVR